MDEYELFEKHWKWFEAISKHLCKDWFVHGYKHGKEQSEIEKEKQEYTIDKII